MGNERTILENLEVLILFCMLGAYSWEDIKKRSITVKYLVFPAALGVVLRILEKNLSWVHICSGAAAGGVVLLLAWATRERIGLGDGVLLTVTGLYLGGAGNLQLLMNGLFCAAVFSLAALVLRKWKKNREIPFVPFLFLGYLIMIVEEWL